MREVRKREEKEKRNKRKKKRKEKRKKKKEKKRKKRKKEKKGRKKLSNNKTFCTWLIKKSLSQSHQLVTSERARGTDRPKQHSTAITTPLCNQV